MKNVRVRLSDELSGYAAVAVDTVTPDSIELVFSHAGRARDKIPALVTGNALSSMVAGITAFAVRTVSATETLNGYVFIEAELADGSTIVEQLPVQITVFTAEKAVPAIGGAAGLMIIVLVGGMMLLRRAKRIVEATEEIKTQEKRKGRMKKFM